jgi:hypothetical protein
MSIWVIWVGFRKKVQLFGNLGKGLDTEIKPNYQEGGFV